MAMILLWVMALAVVASLMPAFVVGLRHSITSGRRASEREARDLYFWATVGLLGLVAYLMEKRGKPKAP